MGGGNWRCAVREKCPPAADFTSGIAIWQMPRIFFLAPPAEATRRRDWGNEVNCPYSFAMCAPDSAHWRADFIPDFSYSKATQKITCLGPDLQPTLTLMQSRCRADSHTKVRPWRPELFSPCQLGIWGGGDWLWAVREMPPRGGFCQWNGHLADASDFLSGASGRSNAAS